MSLTEPTLAPPMAPPTVDMAQIFAAHTERASRIEALRPGNKYRLFDGLTASRPHGLTASRPHGLTASPMSP